MPHGSCLTERLPWERIKAMRTHPLSQLPAIALQEHGLLELVYNEVAARRREGGS